MADMAPSLSLPTGAQCGPRAAGRGPASGAHGHGAVGLSGLRGAAGPPGGRLIEQEPVGTNYLQFESRNPGENTVLNKYDDYWGGSPTVDSVTYKVVSETGSRLAELETGTSDFIVSVQTNNIDRVENNDEATLSTNESISLDYIGFNTSNRQMQIVNRQSDQADATDRG